MLFIKYVNDVFIYKKLKAHLKNMLSHWLNLHSTLLITHGAYIGLLNRVQHH